MRKARYVWIGLIGAVLMPGRAQAREHATVADLEEEVRQSELVIRGIVAEVHWEGFLANSYCQEVTCRIQKIYKGGPDRSEIPLFLNLPDWLHPQGAGRPAQAANPGDELIVPLKELRLLVAEDHGKKEAGPYYTAPSFYVVRGGQIAGSPYALSDGLAEHRRLDRFERLISEIVARRRQFDEYAPGQMLFFDDFDDGSFAGWTFLVGARGGEAKIGDFHGEKWVGPGLRWKNQYPEDQRNTWGELAQNPGSGNYEGVIDGAVIQIGVYDGRLRLRSTRLWHHVTAVVGDPAWQDYEVECDVFNLVDRRLGRPRFPELIAQANYQEFGVYGRVRVPNLPETAGEHSLIAVEFGTYASEVLLAPLRSRVPHDFRHNFCQIRAKWPDGEGGRAGSLWRRTTRILDLAAYPIPTNERIRLKARFMGNRVEGFINDVKYLDGCLDPLPEIMRRGRTALWVFETWAEFDNVKVTELARVEKPGPESPPSQAIERKDGPPGRPEPTPRESPETVRTWTDAAGKFTIEATFVSYGSGIVKLRRKDGQIISLNIEQLSQHDQKYIRDKF